MGSLLSGGKGAFVGPGPAAHQVADRGEDGSEQVGAKDCLAMHHRHRRPGCHPVRVGYWMAMGEGMAHAPGGSVLMVDPQSPAALLTALRGLQERGGSSPVS